MDLRSFRLTILEADEKFYNGDCISLQIPTSDGMFGIMAGHTNMICAISTGIVKYRLPSGEENFASISDGICKVEDGEVLILVDSAERPDEIDIKRAEQEAEDAKEEILRRKSTREYYEAEAQLRRAMNRIRLIKQKR